MTLIPTGPVLERFDQAGIPAESLMGQGKPWIELLERSRRFGADLLIVGRRAANPGEPGLGATPLRLVMHADLDLLLVSAVRVPSGPVLAGLDGSEASMLAAHRAGHLAAMLRRRLLVAGVQPPGCPDRRGAVVRQVAAASLASADGAAEALVWRGWFADTFMTRGREVSAAALVAGRHGANRGPNELIGTQALAMTLATPRAVLIVT